MNNRTRNSARAIVFADNHNMKIRLTKVELEVKKFAAEVAELEAKVDALLAHSSRGHSIAQRWIEVAPELGTLWMAAMTSRANGDDVGFTAAASAAFALIGDAFSHSSDNVILSGQQASALDVWTTVARMPLERMRNDQTTG